MNIKSSGAEECVGLKIYLYIYIFFASSLPRVLHCYTMILQHIRIIVQQDMPDSNPGPLSLMPFALAMSHYISKKKYAPEQCCRNTYMVVSSAVGIYVASPFSRYNLHSIIEIRVDRSTYIFHFILYIAGTVY